MSGFMMEHLNMFSVFAFGIFSLFLQLLVVCSFNSYVKASGNMKTTKKKVLLNLKNQFETIYGMDYQVRNTGAYVEKYLLKLRILGLPCQVWEKVSYISVGIVTLLAGIEIFYQYITNGGTKAMIEIVFSYGITLVCFYVFYHIFGIKNKKAQIQIQLVDYLENYLANRLLRTKNTEKVLNPSMEEAFMDESVENSKIRKEILAEEKIQEEKETKQQAEEKDSFEEDMEMLRQLIKDMERKHETKKQPEVNDWLYDEEGQSQIAAAEDEIKDPNVELLEEFVQNFLA